MKFQEVIDKRHSTREFEKKKVSKSILEKLVKNATKAPSAKNEQPWNFYVIVSKIKRDKLANLVKRVLIENKKELAKLSPKIKKTAINFYNDLGGAQNIIFVYRNKGKNQPPYQYPNDIAAISAAIENLMLSAIEKNLGSCWIGSFKGYEKEVSKILNVKKNQELVTAVLIGYPKKGYKPLKRSKKKLSGVLKFI